MFFDVPRPGGTALNTLLPIENLMQRTEINYYTPKPNTQFGGTKGSDMFHHKTLDVRPTAKNVKSIGFNTRSNSTNQGLK